MLHIRNKWTRLIAIIMLVGFVVTAGPIQALEEIESYSVYTTLLTSLEASAGTWNKTFAAEETNGYVLTLGPEETMFTLTAMSAEKDSNVGPTIIIDGKTVPQGTPSQVFKLEIGEKKNITVEVRARNGGGTLTYELTAYRTNFQSTLRATVGEPLDAAGNRLVQVDYFVPAGTVFKSLTLELSFNGTEMQLANKDGVIPLRLTLGTLVTASDCLKKLELSNQSFNNDKKGSFRLDFNKKEGGSDCVVSDGTTPVLSVYFRLKPDASLSSLKLKEVSVELSDVGLAPQYPGLVQKEGFTCELTLPSEVPEGGQVLAYPAGPYYYGEKVTIMAQPAENYTFAGWNDGQEQQSFEVTLRGDMDLSSLEAEFARETPEQTEPEEATATDSGCLLDETGPVYSGDTVVAYMPNGGMAAISEEEPLGYFVRGEKDGLQEIEPNDVLLPFPVEGTERLLDESANVNEAEAPQPGDTRLFSMRDFRNGVGTADGWAAGEFMLAATYPLTESEDYELRVWVSTDADRGYEFTVDELETLTAGFLYSYLYLAEYLNPVRDTNHNGALDILLYDIYDEYTSGGYSYTGGFVNANEYYCILGTKANPFGNYGDVVHIDVNPQMASGLGQMISTMAHETQHMCTYSAFEGPDEFMANRPPTWVNEGLSMAVEDALFGPLESRIYTFNHSSEIRNGLSLTEWKGTVSNYALSYLFFQYVRTQTGREDFAKEFYAGYGSGQSWEQTLQAFNCFAEKSADEIIRDFYLALWLREGSGPYGFGGESALYQVKPQRIAELPETLAANSAVYLINSDTLSLEPDAGLQYTGVTWSTEPVTVKLAGTDEQDAEVEGGRIAVEYLPARGTASTSGSELASLLSNAKAAYTPTRLDTAKLTATADAGWHFVNWTGVDNEESETNPLYLVLDEAKEVSAVFEQDEPLPTPTPEPTPTPTPEPEPTPVPDSLRLAQVILTEPNQRGLLPRVEDSAVGFDSTINEYDLYLLSNEPDVTLQAVCKSADGGVKAELSHWRDGGQVGMAQTVPNYAGASELIPQTVAEVQDGDELQIRVFNDAGEENIYHIHIHRTEPETDPAGSVTFRSDADGYTRMSIVLKNVTANAVTLELPFAKDTLTFYDREKQPLAESRPEKWSLLEDSDYEIVAAAVKDSEDGTDMSVLELTVALKENAEPTAITMQTVAELYCKVSDSAGEVWHGETAHAELYDMDRIYLALDFPVETGSGQTVTGSFFAYKSEAYTPDDTAFRVYLTADGGAEIAAESVAAGGPDTQGLYEFTYTFEGVSAGTYTLVVNKPGHTPLELSNIQVGAEAYTVTAKPTLTVGDVDGDGWVRTRDKGLLTQHYGAAGESGNAVFDLDGDGWVRTRDLSLLMPNLGKGTLKIIEEVSTDET